MRMPAVSSTFKSCSYTQMEHGVGFLRSCSTLVSSITKLVASLFSEGLFLPAVKEGCQHINFALLPFTVVTAKEDLNTLVSSSERQEKKKAIKDIFNKAIKVALSFGDQLSKIHPVFIFWGAMSKLQAFVTLYASWNKSHKVCTALSKVKMGPQKHLSRLEAVKKMQILKEHIPSVSPEKGVLDQWQAKLSILESKAAKGALNNHHQKKKRSREVKSLMQNLQKGGVAKFNMTRLSFVSMLVNFTALALLSVAFQWVVMAKVLLVVAATCSVAKYIYLRQVYYSLKLFA